MPDGLVAYWYGYKIFEPTWSNWVTQNTHSFTVKNVSHNDGLDKDTGVTITNKTVANAIAVNSWASGSVTDLKLGSTGIINYKNFGYENSMPVYKTVAIPSASNNIKLGVYAPNNAALNTYFTCYALWFEPPVIPNLSIGDITQIGGKNCMYLGGNRFVYMYNLGNTTWDNAKVNAENWSVPSEITDLYNVSDKSLITKGEAELLSVTARQSLWNSFSTNIWTATEQNSSQAYLMYSDGSVNYNYKTNVRVCMTVFTISKK